MPILGSQVVATPSANVVTFNMPKAGLQDGDTIALFIFATDDFNNPVNWPAGFTQIDEQLGGSNIYAAHKTVVTAADEPTNWVITASEFSAANKAVCVAWVMPGAYVKSAKGFGTATGVSSAREYDLTNVDAVGDGNTVFNISSINTDQRPNGTVNGGNGSVTYENTSGTPNDISYAIVTEVVSPSGSSNLGNIVWPITSVSLSNIAMEFGGSVAPAQNAGWISPVLYASDGSLVPPGTSITALIRADMEIGDATQVVITVAADSTVTIDNDAVGTPGSNFDVELSYGTRSLTFRNQTSIDLDA